jgi:hypothetical protein
MSGLSEAGIEIKDVYGKFGDSVQAALFDTLIYVAALRSGDDGALAIR